ncbi:mercury methylation corrinoid protein HgcA [Thermodesulfobacteriota bacterium]
MNQPFVAGVLKAPGGSVPQIEARLDLVDHWGSIKVRWGIGRMEYLVDPGLYALGNPDKEAPVLVTANYKLSFDHLRGSLPDRHAWILVLDTKGVNVWCAAGKGTFGTEELVNRIETSGLEKVVAHRKLILPQLAAPGIAAHQVKKRSGFRVLYGPIRAKDLPNFLDAGNKATPEMRRKNFSILERTVLIPIELVSAMKWLLIIAPILFLIGGMSGPAGFWVNAANHGLFAVLGLFCGVTAGTILTPLLLPWLPGRAFALKGLSMGLIMAGVLTAFRADLLGEWAGRIEVLGWWFLIPAVSAFLAMNFTGASTYTSLSGVRKEMKWAVPLEIIAGVVGLGLWLSSLFIL